MASVDDQAAGEVCQCGHGRRDHIYEEGACRPGFACAAMCAEYAPTVPRQSVTDGGHQALKLAEALCLAVARRYEPDVKMPWVSADTEIQRAYDALRSLLTGEPLPPYSARELARYQRDLRAGKA